jgi:hypothetical protein
MSTGGISSDFLFLTKEAGADSYKSFMQESKVPPEGMISHGDGYPKS